MNYFLQIAAAATTVALVAAKPRKICRKAQPIRKISVRAIANLIKIITEKTIYYAGVMSK